MQKTHPKPYPTTSPDESPLWTLIAWTVVGTITIWAVLVFVVLLFVM